ncbi:MAG: beta strand repeat-containing protein [Sediminibacterium sp.]
MAKSLWLFNLILFFSILKSDNVFSQAPNLINYQGVARNAAGNPLQNQTIYLRVNIRTGSSQGTIQFSETRSVKTNAWGLFAVQIGSPGFMSSIGTLAGVTWMQGDKFMEVEIDPTASNNYINLGSTQLLSVPYALNAVSAGTASPIGGAGGDLSGNYPNPTIANNKITSLKLADSSVVTSKVANFSITDIKIESVSGSKIIGDINGNAKNVNGIVAIANGGTGASNTSDAKKNFLIDSVDNTTDLRKPISIATQNALNLKLNISDTFGTFSNRLKISDTASMLTNRLKISDTANLMLNYRRTTTKIENADLSKSTISGVSLGDNLKSLSTSYGLSGTGFNGSADITDWKVDTAAISTKANVTALLEGYTTTGSIATKLNISDTASMLSNRLRISDTASMLANRLKISDTANFVSNYRRTTTKIENADLSKSTISGVSLGDNLKSLSTSYGLSGTGFNGSADITDWKVDTSAISTKANVTGLLAGYATTGSVGNLDKLTDVKSGGENFSNSIIVGHKQTGTLSNASQNTVLGLEAFKSVTSATNNSVLGFNAMRSNLSGSNNVALGSHALLSNTTGSDNISVGYNAMLNNVSAIGNVAIGNNSLNSGTTGNYNVAVGHQSMVNNTTGDVNTALGYTSLYGNTTGRYNVALGVQALESNTTGNNNTAIGVGTLDRNTGGNENAILGAFAGRYIADGSTYNTSTSNSVLIGANIRVNGVGQSNQIVIGHNAIGNGSNTIQLGNTNITNVKTSGTITAGAVTYPNVDGNNGDLLATNGSGVVSFIAPTLVREVADEFSATANQTSFTLTQTKAANSKVKMFINGVRISNTAYSVVGTTLTYIPANNGNTNFL